MAVAIRRRECRRKGAASNPNPAVWSADSRTDADTPQPRAADVLRHASAHLLNWPQVAPVRDDPSCSQSRPTLIDPAVRSTGDRAYLVENISWLGHTPGEIQSLVLRIISPSAGAMSGLERPTAMLACRKPTLSPQSYLAQVVFTAWKGMRPISRAMASVI